ncbi:hypothetical protein JCM3775_005666 [Rhodotorula graminis]
MTLPLPALPFPLLFSSLPASLSLSQYSISRAILSDAAALVRGDRFFTTDYNAGKLTSVRWEDLKPELDNGSFGGVIGKLLMRHFPAYFTYNAIYALFPFSTPHTTKANLEHLGIGSHTPSSRRS